MHSLGCSSDSAKEAVASADIQQVFHRFLVREENHNFLRFLGFRENDPSKDITEYCMRVHVFGNCPSLAVAIYWPQIASNKREVMEAFLSQDHASDFL